MSPAFILLSMVFCHIIDDYYLQGILAKLKQKSWWQENTPHDLYKHDYIVALIMHAFSWSFMIMLPIFIQSSFQPSWVLIFAFVVNACVHAIVDDLKANKRVINLITDQTCHIAQIISTFALYMGLVHH